MWVNPLIPDSLSHFESLGELMREGQPSDVI